MIIFTSAEIPDTCYVQEVALWLAVGRLPPFIPYEDKGDARFIAECVVESGTPEGYETLGFSPSEFAAAGIQVDWSRYWNSQINEYGSLEWAMESLERYRNMRPSESLPEEDQLEFTVRLNKHVEEIEAAIPELEWAHALDDQLIPSIDRARAVVFQALASGNLKASGWVDSEGEPNPDNYNIEDFGAFQEIPEDVWTLRRFDWKESTLVTPSKTYRVVQVDTAKMLDLFTAPMCRFAELTVRAYGDTAIVVDDVDKEHTRRSALRKRGRPPKGGGLIREAVQNYFDARMKRGQAPKKADALVEEAIEFVRTTFREDISRSTAQSYLAPLRTRRPEIMPENRH